MIGLLLLLLSVCIGNGLRAEEKHDELLDKDLEWTQG